MLKVTAVNRLLSAVILNVIKLVVNAPFSPANATAVAKLLHHCSHSESGSCRTSDERDLAYTMVYRHPLSH